MDRKNCTLYEASTDLPTARVARLIWKVVKPIRPPNFLWRLTDYNPINKFNYHLNSNALPAQTALANYNNFNLQTGLYNLNPNLINTSNQKQAYSTYSTLSQLNQQNLNAASLNAGPNLASSNNLNKLKATSFNRHLTTPTAVTTTTTSLQDLNNLFKLNNERLNAPIGQMHQNELEFNEMQTQKAVQQINLNLNSNLNGNQNLNSNLNSNLKNFNSNPSINLEETDNTFNNSQIMRLNQSNSTFTTLATNLSTKNATIVSSLEIN